MMKGRPLSAKCFMEGVEIPFIGATITSTVGQATIAYVDLVPHETIKHVLPRTLVHLFVKDVTAGDNSYPYVLAFEGEVFGFSFGKTPNSRMFTLSCIDVSSYWDNVLAYFFNAQQSLGKGTSEFGALALDVADSQKQSVINISYSVPVSNYFIQVIKQGMTGGGDFLDGLVNIFHSIGDVNAFYYTSSNRLRLNDRLLIKSSGQLTILLEQDRALKWFEGILGGTTGYQSLRSVVMELMSVIFHDFVSVPFPAYIDSKIGNFVFKPNLFMVPPPMCNVFYPDEYSSFNYSRNFFQEPTRLIYKPEMPMYGGGTPVALLHVFQPPAFSAFMKKKQPTADMIGTADTQVPAAGTQPVFMGADLGHNGKPRQSTSGKAREQQFLSNEERMRGILLAQESMVPASSQFRAALNQAQRANFSSNVAKYLFQKKRFQGRQVQITGHLKLSVVPGFTSLILDDSDTSQSVVAYCSSVTHRIYASQGGYTNTSMSYARTVGEQDTTTGKVSEPLIPPWFSAELFGNVTKGQVNVPAKLSAFFAGLLGNQGSNCITQNTKTTTTVAAVNKLIGDYRAAKKTGNAAVQTLIDVNTRRRYVKLKEAMSFFGATTKATNMDTPFLEFKGAKFQGTQGTADDVQVRARRAIVVAYRDVLKNNRGFRG